MPIHPLLHNTSRHNGAIRTLDFLGEGLAVVNRIPEAETLLTPREVADLFGVDPKTVTRWAKAGKLTSIRTLGGHRRYRKSEVDELRANYFKSQS